MANKIKTITVIPGYAHPDKLETKEGKGYKVNKVTDSVEFTPGDILTRKEVDELCQSKEWKVTVTSRSS
jgi:ribosomal protein S17